MAFRAGSSDKDRHGLGERDDSGYDIRSERGSHLVPRVTPRVWAFHRPDYPWLPGSWGDGLTK